MRQMSRLYLNVLQYLYYEIHLTFQFLFAIQIKFTSSSSLQHRAVLQTTSLLECLKIKTDAGMSYERKIDNTAMFLM